MTLAAEICDQVRRRADFACEYCGITETDAGGRLTVDHFHPQALGGTDDFGNLIYCCYRCNLYKADYWSANPGDPMLWNPRVEPATSHLLLLADGRVYPITAIGAYILQRLRLNRLPIVARRLQRQRQTEESRLLARHHEMVTLLEQLRRQLTTLLDEHRALLEEQRALLKVLVKHGK